jgi:hypothetical protein
MTDIALNDISHALEVLDCNTEARPAAAPAIGKIARLAQSVERKDGALVVAFDSSTASDVEPFADAERSCCATLAWDIREHAEGIELSVRGTSEQLDLLEKLFAPSTAG